VYQEWKERHAGTDLITGSPTAYMRAALVEKFRTTSKIMIATEAAAEGINLQFCSMVVNYDLPWNPQRIEQRIGRCHRYGQKHDVVVINFLNKANAADLRVFELLDEKCRLFSGVSVRVMNVSRDNRVWGRPSSAGSSTSTRPAAHRCDQRAVRATRLELTSRSRDQDNTRLKLLNGF